MRAGELESATINDQTVIAEVVFWTQEETGHSRGQQEQMSRVQ